MNTGAKQPNAKEAKEASLEIMNDRQSYLPRTSPGIQSIETILAAARQPAGRYRSPLSALDRVKLRLHQTTAELGWIKGDSPIFEDLSYPVPPQWRAILNYLYDRGIISSSRVNIEDVFNDGPKLFSMHLFAAYGPNATDGHTTMTPGYSRGVSADFEEALSKVIGELLERYPLTIYRQKDLIRASMQSLARAGKRFLNIHDLAGFSDWQKNLFPERKFDDTSSFSWVRGTELLSGEPALIPAQLVFWNYDIHREPGDPHLRERNTNGAAGHFSQEEAILAAIYELIQRDAFLIHWLNAIPPPRIDPTSVEHPAVRPLLDQYRRYGLEVVLLNTTLDLGLPSCICVLIDKSGIGPRIALGGGCDPDFGNALLRSLTEAWSIHHWLRRSPDLYALRLEEDYKPFRDNGIDQLRRCLLWASGNMFPYFEPFLQGPLQTFRDAEAKFPSSFATPGDELDMVLKVFRTLGRGYEVYVYEAEHEVLSALGYHSVRAVIPALVPLYIREANPPLAARRLREVPSAMGYHGAKEFTPWPHPFP